ncbi:hypothetical protein AB0M46_27275 [Dactylosporangium sp. NPDC051485]|uniref:hypothetical protein n=1 Tax=Dactylosporangium sp. NPDC051485 TaxID=3154846 RepID=UPI003432234D
MIDAKFSVRQSVVVVVALAAVAGIAVFWTSRSDARAAHDQCSAAAGDHIAGPVAIASTERPDDDTFLVHGTAGGRSFVCRVVREPLSHQWEVSSVG